MTKKDEREEGTAVCWNLSTMMAGLAAEPPVAGADEPLALLMLKP